MYTIAQRNIILYFKDKKAVFFSIFNILIIICLYAVFLRTMMIQNFAGSEALMDRWVLAGLVSITPISATLGAFAKMIQDQERGILKELMVAPISRIQIVAGYVLSTAIIAFLMTLVMFIFAGIFLTLTQGHFLPFLAIVQVIGVIVLIVLATSSMILFLVSFAKTATSYSAISSIISTLIGFVAGIYVPMGSFSNTLQFLMKLFPLNHGTVLLRQLLLFSEGEGEQALYVGATERLNQVKGDLGIVFQLGYEPMSQMAHLLVLGFSILIFVFLSSKKLRKELSNN